MTTETLASLAALALVLALLLLLLLRRPQVDLPAEWLARLQALEAATQATRLAVAKNDGALDALAQQLGGFTQSTQNTLETLRRAVDERLAQAVTESRSGRAELLAAFGLFEARLEQRQTALDASLAQRFDGLQQAVAGRLEESSKALLAHLAQGQADSAMARQELSDRLAGFRTELTASTAALAAESVKSRQAMGESTALFEKRIQERFEALTAATRSTLDSLKGDIQGQLGAVSGALRDQLEANGSQIKNQFSVLQDAVSQQLGGLVQGSQHNAEQLRNALNERLAAIQADNATRLEEMRRTVDEKLHATLEQRLGESFKLVSERLEQVHKGLGEMQTLAGSVGDLKRVMSNVKSRGTWGEMQLGAIIENVLTPEQFARNVKTVPGSDELVEFAIRLPGRNDVHPVWLPIDAKYPVEQYQRLMDAQDAADKAATLSAGNAFETSVRNEARKIFAKYVSPPHTTDFAVLYLPTESLFAEVMRRPGLVEAVQNECRVMITGPANLAAMLNSLQMGFKTLAIEKRSSEVWSLLGSVKTEFAKFGDVVEATKKSIDAAARRFDEVGVRTRAIERKLRAVQELPAPDAALPLADGAAPGAQSEDDAP
ncbi:DNA recombination protein RmuC [Verminephrobacter aporrectodeae subsp. tuberculatae]|uniref:DNA recombination protein RmuC n=1 Tax=Verminephrobacter aporrectodeae TaxID=1110389 RepID=UPI002237CF6A|nr:DNA recombination protein RmuC [Verminephrobacter aporrectodeae]MCW5221048.1 DNA recombination protein RmuC [Verminephrobacter aporrectodeae subsp. tuberculatae]MCW5290341.1 DNA recombination protein RmuC [Verminephrobacter aporrectodeae subsp. tuberculatae]